MDKENEKVIVKKKKFKFTKFIIVLLLLYIIGFYCYKIVMSPIKNIVIKNNNYISDQEVIDNASLKNYPSFLLTLKYSIKNKLLKNSLIKDVKIKKKIGNIVEITIEENIPLFIYNNKVILDNSKEINKSDFILPIVVNNIDEDMLDKLIKKYINIDEDVRLLISEIKYVPNDIDKERFLFTMNDGNYVYITLYKITSINEYIKIYSTLENKKGILYLDSGNYFEIFK